MAQDGRIHGHGVRCVFAVCGCLPLGHDSVHQGQLCAGVSGLGRQRADFGADFGTFLEYTLKRRGAEMRGFYFADSALVALLFSSLIAAVTLIALRRRLLPIRPVLALRLLRC